MSFTGESLLTKTSGAPGKLRGEDSGTFEPQPDGAAAIEIAITIVGGSGSYHGSSGTLRASGRLEGSSGRTAGVYAGVVSR